MPNPAIAFIQKIFGLMPKNSPISPDQKLKMIAAEKIRRQKLTEQARKNLFAYLQKLLNAKTPNQDLPHSVIQPPTDKNSSTTSTVDPSQGKEKPDQKIN